MKKKNKSICIEFVGIWGAGKSTLKKNINDLLKKEKKFVKKDSDSNFYSKKIKFFFIINLFINYPLASLKEIFFFLKIFLLLKPIDKVEIDIFKTLIKVNIIKKFLLKKGPEILLMEGICHLLPIFRNMEKLKKKDLLYLVFLSGSYSDTFFIFLELDFKNAYQRVINDHKKKIYRFTKSELKNLKNKYKIMLNNQNKIKKILPKKNIFFLKGRDSVKKNSRKLLVYISNNIKFS